MAYKQVPNAALKQLPNPYQIEIYPSERIYYPGDTVQGEVVFRLTKKLHCNAITAQIYGNARVFWMDDNAQGKLLHGVPYEQTKTLIDETKIIWGKRREGAVRQPSLDEIVRYSNSLSIRPKKLERKIEEDGLGKGVHKIGFSFELPKSADLPTSFQHQISPASVRYFIRIRCFLYDEVVAKQKELIAVVQPVNLNENLRAIEGAHINERIRIPNKDGYVDVDFRLSKKGFVPGEAITATVFIDNRSGKSVKYAHLSILQRVSCIANYPTPAVKDCFIESCGVGLPVNKIVSGSSYKYSPQFNVPALVPDSAIGELLYIDYQLKFDIGFFRNCGRINCIRSLSIPIFIGTVPVSEDIQSAQLGGTLPAKQIEDFSKNDSLNGWLGVDEGTGSEGACRRGPSIPPPCYSETEDAAALVVDADLDCPRYSPPSGSPFEAPVNIPAEGKTQKP